MLIVRFQINFVPVCLFLLSGNFLPPGSGSASGSSFVWTPMRIQDPDTDPRYNQCGSTSLTRIHSVGVRALIPFIFVFFIFRRCNTHFCWLCGEKLPAGNPYSHFNLLGGACYGALFQVGVLATNPYSHFNLLGGACFRALFQVGLPCNLCSHLKGQSNKIEIGLQFFLHNLNLPGLLN